MYITVVISNQKTNVHAIQKRVSGVPVGVSHNGSLKVDLKNAITYVTWSFVTNVAKYRFTPSFKTILPMFSLFTPFTPFKG